ncbi:hypothetical protein JXB11_02820 [Candidatus Woesearchaeota archaeon]|nr:hypothetical protein [Candidatus Woesearchaeota archaeon]
MYAALANNGFLRLLVKLDSAANRAVNWNGVRASHQNGSQRYLLLMQGKELVGYIDYLAFFYDLSSGHNGKSAHAKLKILEGEEEIADSLDEQVRKMFGDTKGLEIEYVTDIKAPETTGQDAPIRGLRTPLIHSNYGL